MKKIKNKKALGIAALVGGLAVIGGTFAYYADSMIFRNLFTTAEYIVDYTETFESPENWAPCAETPKTVTATNRGNIPVGVRIKIDEFWKSQSDEDLPLTVNVDGEDLHIAQINFDENNRDKWLFDGEYYYYYRELNPGETTESLLKSVTFNCAVNFVSEDITYTQTETGVIGMSHENEYLKSKYHLNVKVQTIQRNEQYKRWGGPSAKFPEGWIISHEGWAPYSKYFTTARVATVKKIARAPALPNYEVLPKNTEPSDGVNYVIRIDDGTTDLRLYAWIEDEELKLYSNAPLISTAEDMNYAFEHYTNLTDISELANWYWGDTKTVTAMFRGDTSLSDITPLTALKTATITDVARLFDECIALTDITPLGEWNVKIRGTDANGGTNNVGLQAAFEKTSFTDVSPLAGWDVSEAKNMAYLFANSLVNDMTPLSTWDTGNVITMEKMFHSGQKRNASINTAGMVNWDISNVTSFRQMFKDVVSSAPTTGSWENGTWDSSGTFTRN